MVTVSSQRSNGSKSVASWVKTQVSIRMRTMGPKRCGRLTLVPGRANPSLTAAKGAAGTAFRRS